jgi:hypothetical protein
MSPTAYRTLEAIADQAVPIADRQRHVAGHVHPGPAEALIRRGLARTVNRSGRAHLAITPAGRDLLASNPAPRS